MLETLVPIKLPPGVYRNGTTYQGMQRWIDSQLVRWFEKTIQPVGGWRAVLDDVDEPLSSLAGVARAALAWRSASGGIQVGVGTNSRLYVLIAGVLTDITPTGLTTGPVDSSYAGGLYGAGAYGSGLYGTGSLAQALTEAGTWQLDTFGDWLAGVLSSDGKLYVWEGSPATPAEEATGAPTSNRAVVATPERFLVALGAGGNVRLVKWASQETIDDWTATDLNTAGDKELETNGRIMCGRRTRSNTLIWTDVDLHEMAYIGGELVYGFRRVGDSCGIISPNAVSVLGDASYWMGREDFHRYDGYVEHLQCDVRDYVFGDFNATQAAKVFSLPLNKFNEIWWFYCSANSDEIDRYVIYNHHEKHWAIGMLPRTAGFDEGAAPYPMMFQPAFAAQGTLTSTGTNPANAATVTIGAKVYTFQTVLTDVDGNVFIGANAAATLANLFDAINLGPGAGTDYATSTTRHPTVTAEAKTATTVLVRAKISGAGGNAIATTETSVQLAWGAATLVGGGAASGYVVTDVFEHEVLEDRGEEVPFAESGPFELDDGNTVVRVQRIVPDERTQGDVRARLFGSFFPNEAETEYGPFSMTNPTDVRFTARQVRLRFEEVNQTSWRVGTMRLGAIPGGRR